MAIAASHARGSCNLATQIYRKPVSRHVGSVEAKLQRHTQTTWPGVRCILAPPRSKAPGNLQERICVPEQPQCSFYSSDSPPAISLLSNVFFFLNKGTGEEDNPNSCQFAANCSPISQSPTGVETRGGSTRRRVSELALYMRQSSWGPPTAKQIKLF